MVEGGGWVGGDKEERRFWDIQRLAVAWLWAGVSLRLVINRRARRSNHVMVGFLRGSSFDC